MGVDRTKHKCQANGCWPNGTPNANMPKLDDPTKENSTTVVQGIANAKHTLEIIADNPASPPAITGVRTYRPPVKAD